MLAPERIRAVETGACPHTAIRDDVTANLLAVEDLEADFAPLDIVLVESGGDNLTATFSPALVDAQIFVLDVAGGGDVARKGGPGIGRADLLVVNKTDLGPYVGVDVPQMVADGKAARDGRPVIGLSRLDRASIDDLTAWVRGVLRLFRSGGHVAVDPGPMAPHSHAEEGGAASVHRHGDGPLHSHQHTDTTTTTTKTTHDHRPNPHHRVTLIRVRAAPGRARLTVTDGPIGARIIRTDDTGARVGLVGTQALLLGGDHIEIEVDVGPGAWLELVETAGTVAYDADGRASSWTVRIRIADGGRLVWAGEPFVVSHGANVHRSTDIDLGVGAVACCGRRWCWGGPAKSAAGWSRRCRCGSAASC